MRPEQRDSDVVTADLTTVLLANLVRSASNILAARVLTFDPTRTVQVGGAEGGLVVTNSSQDYSVDQEPWYIDRSGTLQFHL